MKIFQAVCAGAMMLLSGCSSAKVEDYANNNMPTLDIRDYLNGDLEAWGMFVDRSGKADPMFHVQMQGAWNGNTGTLKEHFVYNDGKVQDRMWTLTFQDDHHFTATAPDIVGTAVGEQYGNAANIKYVLTVTPQGGGSSHDMTMDDWLYRMNDEVVLNRNSMSKFGIKVGELVITFHRPKQ